MFDGIKAMLQGWRHAGCYPNVSPKVALGYMEAVLECIEHMKLKKKMFLDLIVEVQDENIVPFEMSFDAHPFSVATAYAFCKSNDGKDAEYYASVLASLSSLAKKIAETRIDCGFYEAFLLREEEREIASLILRNIEQANKKDMIEKNIDWGVLLISTYTYRARTEYRLLQQIRRDISIHQEDGSVSAYADSSAINLLERSTKFPTQQKMDIVSLYTRRCIDNLNRMVP